MSWSYLAAALAGGILLFVLVCVFVNSLPLPKWGDSTEDEDDEPWGDP